MAERLQKLIAQAGIASRRGAEQLILDGEVSVNGDIVTELGTKADPEKDHIKVRGKLINPRISSAKNVYVLVNKPKGYLSSVSDPEGRKLVVELVKGKGRLHPVGRLDYNSEGLIILTNDGKFTDRVASSKTVAKVYDVKVKGLPNKNAINKLRRGILLEDGFKTAPAEIRELNSTDKNGWVVKLRRTKIGDVSDPYLKTGQSRDLSREEVASLTGSQTPVRAERSPKPQGTAPNGSRSRTRGGWKS